MLSKLSATTRIVLSLASLSTSLVLVASVLGLLPDGKTGVTNGRMRLCESLAITFSSMARQADVTAMRNCLEAVLARNPEMRSLGVRRSDGSMLIDIGQHSKIWSLRSDEQSTATQMVVPIHSKTAKWGALEVSFVPVQPPGKLSRLIRPEFTLAGFMGMATLLSYYFYLRTVLRQLNPSKVIPGRVREAFDSLSEGLVVLDGKERVVLVNRAFEQVTGKESSELLGRPMTMIPFVQREEGVESSYPWKETLAESRRVHGRLLGLTVEGGNELTFSVSSAPILDEKGKNKGALASFEDVTWLEKKKRELQEMVEHLHASGEQIRRQNQELELLATRDPLTGCLNRRAFLQLFETAWSASQRYGHPLSGIMVDVDHFKSVNDKHGHATGDEVLKKVAATLMASARDSDIVARFGGEEFAILLPNTDLDHAERAAEKFRLAIEALVFPQLSVTASLGVSGLSQGPECPQELLEQADKCLYVAKRNGRNQVVRWDKVPEGLEVDESTISRTQEEEASNNVVSIPYHAVTALISALAYRDQETAAHSRRVADLCVAAAEGLLGIREIYTLEIAALLHDIGKIGVPDAILLKPGPLTQDEWQIMRRHDSIGAEIIRASFQSSELSEIIESHHAGGGNRRSDRSDASQSVGARLLSIADAYDAMVSDRVYRQGRTPAAAIEELRRCAGTQFDPELVERFVRMLRVRDSHHDQGNAMTIPKEAALHIGMQIERLMTLLDSQDLDRLGALALRLNQTATRYGAWEVAEKAAELETALRDDPDIMGVMQSASELLDLCRSTQSSFVACNS